MIVTLAAASLIRHRARTTLAILGVAVSAALLLDMVMLSTGMRESFGKLLLAQGFQLRLAPKGTLPFDTEATMRDADGVVALLRSRPSVQAVSPVLGGQLHFPLAATTVTAAALGLEPAVQGDYELVEGRDPTGPDEMVTTDAVLRAVSRTVGDTIRAAAGYDAQMRSLSGERVLRIVGRARFIYLALDQRAVALPIATLRTMSGPQFATRASVAMVRVRPGVDVERERDVLERLLPRVTVISTAAALEQVD
ncbi:MAG: ABC transporter permease, partial [Gemmatimonadaceae bacterium]